MVRKMQRRASRFGRSPEKQVQHKTEDDDDKRIRQSKTMVKVIGIAVLLASAYLVKRIISNDSSQSVGLRSSSQSGHVFHIDKSKNVQFVVDFEQPPGQSVKGDIKVFRTGSHSATLSVPTSSCPNPGFWARLEGQALSAILLTENKETSSWNGNVHIPVEGTYELVAYWYGCNGMGPEQKTTLQEFQAKGKRSATSTVQRFGDFQSSLFPPADWAATNLYDSMKQFPQQPYILANFDYAETDSTFLKIGASGIVRESVALPETQFYQFAGLSNYELVCWVGSESAVASKKAFHDIRGILFGHQRPFKFHMYDISSFTKPDAKWELDTKKRFRKCKHILVSLDEFQTPLSQNDYMEQVKTFLNHLLKAFPDPTFPIWMFTMVETPSKAVQSRNCHSPILPRSSDHPCNVALREVFQKTSFPDRVRLMDNADITLPQLGNQSEDVWIAIAMRIFLFVGKQVKVWRDAGQIGGISGLKRGEKIEPNFELVPYTGWS